MISLLSRYAKDTMFTKWIFFQKRNASDQQVHKRYLTLLTIREAKTKSRVRFHLTLVRWLSSKQQNKRKKKKTAYICLRNLYAGQEAKIGTRHGTTDFFQIGKGVHQGCILSPCLFNLNAEYIM